MLQTLSSLLVAFRKVPSLCFKVIVFTSRFLCSVSSFSFGLQREVLGCLLTRRASFLLADGRWFAARESCYRRMVAIVLDGRPSRPATDGKFSATGTAATAVRFFSAKGKPLFQPSIQPHTHVLRVLVGKFPMSIEEAVSMPLEPP